MGYRITPTPGPWQVAEFSKDHIDALPGEIAVFAPQHPDSKQKEDGTWAAVTICRGMTGERKEDNATVIALVPEMIEVLKLCYIKHHLGNDVVGWDELSDKLADVLSNALGPEGLYDLIVENKMGD